jgi:GntR family transcriptional regulator, rspAB operon transcriptional repressor
MDKSSFPQINRERASDSVYQILRDGILTQVFQPGERLNVKELADKLGVSQTPLKEAISRLAIEGLIDINPRSGTYVTSIDTDDIADTFEIRLALECLAAEKALGKMAQSDLNKMRALIAELEKPVRTDNERSLHEQTNVEFHNLIVELAGSRKLEEMYHSLNAHIQIARVHHSRQDWERRTEQEQEEHGEILRAFEARDPDRLINALRQHIRRAASCLVEDLKKGNTANS